MNTLKSATKLSSTLRLFAAASLAVVGLGLMGPAQAHDELVSTNPAQNSSLETAPQSVELNYSGELTEVEGSTQVRVTDSKGNEIAQGEPTVKDKTVTQNIDGHGNQDETYTVTWRVVSSDGHPIQGRYEMTVGEGSSTAASSSASSSETNEVAEGSTQGVPSNTVLKIGIFVVGALVVIGAIIATIAKTRRTQR